MKLVVFGLSITSSWGNGHATTFRALLRAFAERGNEITFYEWDAPWYRGHRDFSTADYCRIVLYEDWDLALKQAIEECRAADAVMVGSYVKRGIDVIDALFEAGAGPLFFYDIDTPVTVQSLRSRTSDYLRSDQIPRFDAYLSFTGGPWLNEVLEAEFGAPRALPLYCCVDAERHSRAESDPALEADLAYMGTYAADRQPVIEALLNEPARQLPARSFLVAGPQYPSTLRWSPNVRLIDHIPPPLHGAFYSSARWQLNATRRDMIAAGWSPSVRLFEAGAVGAAVISDYWDGLESFFIPGREILLPRNAAEVVEILEDFPDQDRRSMGMAMRERVLAEHASSRRAGQLEAYLMGRFEESLPVGIASQNEEGPQDLAEGLRFDGTPA